MDMIHQFDDVILYAALSDKDKDLFDAITPEMFTDKTLGRIYKYANDIYRIGYKPTYEDVLHYIDSAEKENHEKKADELRAALKKNRNGVYVYDKSVVDIFVKAYQTRAVHTMSERMKEVGEKYSIETARKEVGELYEVLKYGHRLRTQDTFDTLKMAAIRRVDEQKGDITDRMTIINPWMVRTFGKNIYNRLYIIGGLPSMGKSQVADNFILHLSDTNPGIYFSFDNSATETMSGLASIALDIDYDRIIDNNMYPDEMERFKKYKPKNDIVIVDQRLSATEITSITEREAQNYKRKNKRLGWVVLDYFQNIKIKNKNSAVEEYQQAISAIKFITKKLGVAFIVLSQSNDKERRFNSKVNEDLEDVFHDFFMTDLKWCAGLGEEAYFVAGMCGRRGDDNKIIKVVKDKRGALRKCYIKIKKTSAQIKEIQSHEFYDGLSKKDERIPIKNWSRPGKASIDFK
jgi:replicative DNA helicase